MCPVHLHNVTRGCHSDGDIHLGGWRLDCGTLVGTLVGTHVGMAPVGSPSCSTRIALICPLLYEAYKRIQELEFMSIDFLEKYSIIDIFPQVFHTDSNVKFGCKDCDLKMCDYFARLEN